MIGIAQIHTEVVPGSVLKDTHIPRSRDRVGELPDDVVSVFIGESFKIGLNDGISALPQMRAQCVKHVAAFFSIRSLQMLECVDGFDIG